MRPASCAAQNVALGYYKERLWNAPKAFFNCSKGRGKERIRRNPTRTGTTKVEVFRRTRKKLVVFEIDALRSIYIVH
jgi:hypothetical protein